MTNKLLTINHFLFIMTLNLFTQKTIIHLYSIFDVNLFYVDLTPILISIVGRTLFISQHLDASHITDPNASYEVNTF